VKWWFCTLTVLFFQSINLLQIEQMKLKDQRIKLMNEVLNGIKVRIVMIFAAQSAKSCSILL